MTPRALLFTDLVDSTRLIEQLGDVHAATLWSAHDRQARALLDVHHGREIDRSDGFFLLFDEAGDAARYALDYHQALGALALSARVGLHVGPVALRENPPHEVALGAKPVEIDGLAKPLAARIMALAAGGQTLLSAAAREAIAGAIPAGATVERHGHYRLKGVEEPVEIFEIGVAGRSPLSPPADADKAYRVVRAGEDWRPVRDVRHSLPAARDSFVGRSSELRALAARLDAGTRLLTVLGPGGTGKTRLVCRYAWTWLGDWPGGVYFCDLSEARSVDGIFGAVAVALDVPLGKDEPGVQIGHALAGRGRCLVILDNFEQICEHAPGTVGRWLDRAAAASFVVTSRERLHLPGEEAFPIEPLPLEMDAIDLFVARARSHRPDFALGDTNRAAIAEVVRLLDGLPLAIELAAARVRVLSPVQLGERMRDRFRLLAGNRGVAARQATLRAAIDWSWDLLVPWERAAFAQCSVFEGGFTLEAAESVLELSAWAEAPPVMDAIQALVDKSLLRTGVRAARARDGEEEHFGMYISLHQYAAEKLEALGSAEPRASEQRHGGHFARFGTQAELEALFRHAGVDRRRRLALDLDNLVAACRRAIGRGDGEVAVPTFRAVVAVVDLQGPFALGVALGTQVLALPGLEPALRSAAAEALGQTLRRCGRVDEAWDCLSQARALAVEAGDRQREAGVVHALGSVRREQARMGEARALFERAREIGREVADRRTEGSVLLSLGLVHREQGRIDEARLHLEAALAASREMGNRREEGIVLGSLGLLHSELGRAEQAVRFLEDAIVIAREVGDLGLEGTALANLGQLRSEQGLKTQAVRHLEAALAIQRQMGNRRLEGIALGNLGSLDGGGPTELALERLAEALAIAREVGNRRHQGFLLVSLGIIHHGQGRMAEAASEFAAALAVAREVGDRRTEGITLNSIGALHGSQDRYDDARLAQEQALALARELGFPPLEGVALRALGDLLLRQGEIGAALSTLRESEAILRGVADPHELAQLLCIRGLAESAAGDRVRWDPLESTCRHASLSIL